MKIHNINEFGLTPRQSFDLDFGNKLKKTNNTDYQKYVSDKNILLDSLIEEVVKIYWNAIMDPNIKIIYGTINANIKPEDLQNFINFLDQRKKVNLFLESNKSYKSDCVIKLKNLLELKI